MKKAFLSLILFCCAAAFGSAQMQRRTVQPKPATAQAKAVQKKPSANAAAEIPDVEWKTLSYALAAEDWDKSAPLALRFLNRLKVDNEKKQLAQLRYLYLYALAGKVFNSTNQHNDAGENNAREELVRAAARFTGRDFVLPAREFLYDCKNVVNYICAAKNGGDKLFRTTATGKGGTEIHSFDYVSFDEAVDLKFFASNKIFLGGTLRAVEFNYDLKQPWVMRLVFNKGFVSSAVG